MSWYRILFGTLVIASLVFTFLAALVALKIFPFSASGTYTPVGRTPLLYLALATLQPYSVGLAPAGWTTVLGVWIWRGKIKSAWMQQGFDRDTFKSLLQMKGGPTRTAILKSLSAPKDRLQLSRDLGLDWTTIDYHMRILLRHGLVNEKAAYGRVKIYETTAQGKDFLRKLQETSKIPA